MASEIVNPLTGARLPVIAIGESGVELSPNTLARVLTSRGPFTVLLPDPTTDTNVVLVLDGDSDAAANPITVDGNGHTIDGSATATLNVDGILAAFVFDGGEWRHVLPLHRFDPEFPFVWGADVNAAVPPVVPFDLTIQNDGVDVEDFVDLIDFIGGAVAIIAPGHVSFTPAVIFRDAVAASKDNISTSRTHPSPVDPTKTGITNLGSDTGGALGATADDATIIGGRDNEATGIGAIAGGVGAHAGGDGSIALGVSATTTQHDSISIGNTAQGAGLRTICIGVQASVESDDGTAIGLACAVSNESAQFGTALGHGSLVRARGGVALGTGCEVGVLGFFAQTFGPFCQGLGPSSFSAGEDSIGGGTRAVAIGQYCEAWSTAGAAFGNSNRANQAGSFARGVQAISAITAQDALSGGRFTNGQTQVAAAAAQSSRLVMRASTPGLAVGEVGELLTGAAGSNVFETQNNRAYTVTARVTMTGTLADTTEHARSIQRTFGVLHRGGVADVTFNTLDYSEPAGDMATADWDLVVGDPGASLEVTTGTTQAKTYAVCELTYGEVIFPIDAPTDVPDLTLWLDSMAGVTLAAGAVSAWADQSGAGNSFSQATAGARPTFVPGVTNGRAAIRFDGVDDLLVCGGKTLADLIDADVYTVILVGAWRTSTGTAGDLPGQSAMLAETNGVWGYSADAGQFTYGWQVTSLGTQKASSGYASAVGSAEIQNVYTFEYELGRLLRLERNVEHNRPSEVTADVSSLTGVPRLGANHDGTAFAGVDIYEVLIWDRDLTDEEREAINQWLWDRYALGAGAVPPTANLIADWNAFFATTAAGPVVTSLPDQSGHGNDATAPGGAEPTYVPADANFNNLPSALFPGAGTTRLVSTALGIGAGPYTIYLVAVSDIEAHNRRYLSNTADDIGIFHDNGGAGIINAYVGAGQGLMTTTDDASIPSVLCLVCAGVGGSATLYVNDPVSGTSVAVAGGQNVQALMLGNYAPAVNAAFAQNGSTPRVLVYNAEHDGPTRTRIMQALATEYGT